MVDYETVNKTATYTDINKTQMTGTINQTNADQTVKRLVVKEDKKVFTCYLNNVTFQEQGDIGYYLKLEPEVKRSE